MNEDEYMYEMDNGNCQQQKGDYQQGSAYKETRT